MNNNMQVNIIFYSKFCQMSRDLIKMMTECKILGKFVLKCIEDMQEHEIPASLTRVPTLIVSGIQKPLVANDAILWFKKNQPIFMQQIYDTQNKIVMRNIMKNNMQSMNGPKGYLENEYSGISDSFAYADENLDLAQPKVYTDCNGSTDVIYTPPLDGKIKENESKKLIFNAKKEYEQQDKECGDLLRKQQLEILVNHEAQKLMQANRYGL